MEPAIHYIAEILGQFDLIAIVELRDNLEDLISGFQIRVDEATIWHIYGKEETAVEKPRRTLNAIAKIKTKEISEAETDSETTLGACKKTGGIRCRETCFSGLAKKSAGISATDSGHSLGSN